MAAEGRARRACDHGSDLSRLALQRARRRRAPHAAAHRLCADAAKGRPQLFLDRAQAVEQHPRALEDLAEVGEPATLEPALATLGKAGAKLRFDRESASAALVDGFNAAGGKAEVGTNPIALMKAVKNEAEREGARQAQIRDGAAMARFLLCWLDRRPEGQADGKSRPPSRWSSSAARPAS